MNALELSGGDLLTPAEAAVFLGCSVCSVYRLTESGRLGFFRVESAGGSIRISGIRIEQFLAAHLAESALGETALVSKVVQCQFSRANSETGDLPKPS